MYPGRSNPPGGADMGLGAGRGRKMGGGRTDAVCGGRCGHAARGTETSNGGRRVVGVGDVQVDGVPRRESMWGSGAIERCYGDNRYWWGGGSKEEERKRPRKLLRQVGQGNIINFNH